MPLKAAQKTHFAALGAVLSAECPVRGRVPIQAGPEIGLTARVARSDCPGGQVQPPGRVTLSHARLSRQLQGNFDTDLHNA